MQTGISPENPLRRHWLVLAGLAAVALLFAASPTFLPQAAAQEGEGDDEIILDDGEEQPAEEPEATDGEGEDEQQTSQTDEEEDDAGSKSFLTWMIEASGWFGLLILLCSFAMVALIVMNLLQVRRDNFLPPMFIEQFESQLREKKYQEAYELARSDESFLARVLAAGLAKLSGGYSQAIESMQEVGEEENMALEHRLSYLALIGTVSPMLGLLGTVWGMIESFRVIATSTSTPNPSELADGISTALFTTLEGLFVAIPAIAAYGILRNRVQRLVLEVGIVSESLMSRFSTVGRRPGPGTAPAGAPASPSKE